MPISNRIKKQALPPSAKYFPFSLILRLFPAESVLPTEAQKQLFRQATQQTDTLADNLVAAMKKTGPDSRKQFAQAVEHGIETIKDPLPEMMDFFNAMDNTPAWVDKKKIRRAQQAMSRVPASTLISIMISFGLPASYIVSRVNQTLIRTGNLELKAASRLIETTSWIARCATVDGLNRFADGFKATANVRLVHAYMRSGLARQQDWDYDAWDVPINQAQQALTLIPFIIGSLLTIPLGTPMGRRDVAAILHLWRYISHLMGIDPALQITSLEDVTRLLWLTAWAEIKPDEWTPILNQALQDTIPVIYNLPKRGLLAGPAERFLRQYHSDMGRLVLGKHYGDALGFQPLSPLAGLVLARSVCSFGVGLTVKWACSLSKRTLDWRIKNTEAVLGKMADRVKADLSYNKSVVTLNKTRIQPKNTKPESLSSVEENP